MLTVLGDTKDDHGAAQKHKYSYLSPACLSASVTPYLNNPASREADC